MAILYIKEQGASIVKRGERILVEKNRNTLLDIPVDTVENMALIGNVQITTQLLHLLMEKGVDISYFSYSGKYLGHSCAESSRNIFLRLAQYKQYNDQELRLEMARNIVGNKIMNQVSLLRHFRWDGIPYDWKKDVLQMEKQKNRLGEMRTANQILGLEGLCSNIYFGAYGKIFKCSFSFEGRNRRPPKDPINVILSLGYTFLTREVSMALEAESFEMYLGFLHGLRYGRKSLALDIVEEFRQPVVDRLALRLFNKKMLGELDFDMEEDRVILNEDGFRTFCKEYERWMSDKSFARSDIAFRNRIRKQAASLKQAIQNKTAYQPFCWRYPDVCD